MDNINTASTSLLERHETQVEKDRLDNTPILYLVRLTKAMRLKEILISKLSKEEQLILIDREELLSTIAWGNPWKSLNLDPSYNECENLMSYIEVLDMLEFHNEDEELYAWKLGIDNQTGKEIIKSRQEIIDDLYAYSIKTKSSRYWTE